MIPTDHKRPEDLIESYPLKRADENPSENKVEEIMEENVQIHRRSLHENINFNHGIATFFDCKSVLRWILQFFPS